MLKTAFTIIFLFMIGALQAQLKEFEVKDMEPPETQVVQGNTKYADNAMVLVYSDKPELYFRSSIGGINQQRYNRGANRYELLISPQKQILFVQHKGFMEGKLTIVNPESKEVFYYIVDAGVDKVNDSDPQPIRIETKIENATVRLDGSTIGKTDRNGILEFFRFPGEYKLTVIKENYLEVTEDIFVKKGAKNYFAFELTKNIGYLHLNVTPDDAEIKINKEPYNNKKVELAPGVYQLLVERQYYTTFKGNINIELEETLEKTINLEPHTGTLLYSSNPTDAKAELENEAGEIVETWTGVKKLNNLLVGTYTLKVKSEGYTTNTQKIKILRGESLDKQIKLDPYSARTYFHRGIAKAHLGNHRRAVKDFNKSIKLDPHFVPAYFLRGVSKLNLNRKNSACKDFSKAGELGHERAYDMIKKHCN